MELLLKFENWQKQQTDYNVLFVVSAASKKKNEKKKHINLEI